VDALTLRAERALLGAIITDPELALWIRLSPYEFADARHGSVYSTIRMARQTRFAGPDGWRATILQAAASVTEAELDDLARACPFAPHGPAYAVMVVQAWARRYLGHSAEVLGARSTQLGTDAERVMLYDEPAGAEMTFTAEHMREVAAAIHEHARDLSPQVPARSSGRRRGASPERVRREEVVLAGLLRQNPERNADIVRILPAEAFGNPHRQEIYQVARAMYLSGKPVDELTLDWELASRGVPLDARQSYVAARGEQTYAMHLARLEFSYQEPITAARELTAEYGQSRSGHPAGSALRPSGARPAARTRDSAQEARPPGRPALRLVQPPPQAGPPEHGPQQARLRMTEAPRSQKGPPDVGGPPGQRDQANDLGLEVTHAQMDAAVDGGDTVPLALAGGWLAGYRGAWWVLSEIGWLRVTDEATVADINRVAARLAEVAEDADREAR
jgi:hypothetical protein